jgi:SAM-dependent MidA family methyltransferase
MTQAIAQAGGWLPFDDFMALALYAPGWGYYSGQRRKFGQMPQSGSDFVTAPELSAQFGRALARQVAQALQATGTSEVWEFGAGSGALAQQVITALQAQGVVLRRYVIVELSASLRERQQQALQHVAPGLVQWVDALPEAIEAVVLGNEVLDAMPVKLLMRRQGVWHERGVRLGTLTGAAQAAALPLFAWQDRVTRLRPPLEIEGEHDYLTEIHPQAESFMRTLAERLTAGAAFFIDYGFPEHEYYHPQRHMGTVMCHQAHLADADPLARVGQKDITAHVNFTGIALAAQDAGLEVLGYCSQARFLLNCGLAEHMQASDLTQRVQAQRLVMEHEMGELFKVIGLCRGEPWAARGFAQGDRTHTL